MIIVKRKSISEKMGPFFKKEISKKDNNYVLINFKSNNRNK